MGAGWNVRRVYFLATGKYFKWAACDNMCELTFIERCVEALERDPELVVAHAKTQVVDENGKFLEDYEWPLATDSPHRLTRFRDLLLNDHMCYQIFGVMRVEALKKLPPQGSYVKTATACCWRRWVFSEVLRSAGAIVHQYAAPGNRRSRCRCESK